MRYHIVSTYDLETDDDGGQHGEALGIAHAHALGESIPDGWKLCDGESRISVLLGIPDTVADVPETVRHGVLGRYRSIEPPGTLVLWTSLLSPEPVTIIGDESIAGLGSATLSCAVTLGPGWWAHYDTDGRRLCAGSIDADGCRPDHSAIVHGSAVSARLSGDTAAAEEAERTAAFRLTFPREGRPSVEFITETET